MRVPEPFAIYHGDCRDTMSTFAPNCIDAVVTDPPYGLSFMGKDWDHGIPGTPFWTQALRVAKPGAHLLAFGGTRTFHRLAVAIEDAGWEIRDCVLWLYGSGFPKSHNLDGDRKGWGTALKPSWEPVLVARKPLSGTVAANVSVHGTGALNVDGCRIVYSGPDDAAAAAAAELRGKIATRNTDGWGMRVQSVDRDAYLSGPAGSGRWPANVCHDGSPEVLAGFPSDLDVMLPDSGCSAARFFYCAKASREDREAGLREAGLREAGLRGLNTSPTEIGNPRVPIMCRNHHPTVKPTELMRWLCRLVTPPNGIVLDPFMGSGSTGKAARLEGFRFIGIDLSQEYVEIARARIAAVDAQTSLFEAAT